MEPIRRLQDIRRIKAQLKSKPRDLCLFTFGINTAFRANELLSIRVGDVLHLRPGERFELKQRKTQTYRAITVNKVVVETIKTWLAIHPRCEMDAPLFISQKTGGPLQVSVVSQMVKGWCADAGLPGNYGSHSLRKTWGYQQRVERKAPIPLLMEAFGHATQRQTLDYLCIQAEEIQELYALEL